MSDLYDLWQFRLALASTCQMSFKKRSHILQIIYTYFQGHTKRNNSRSTTIWVQKHLSVLFVLIQGYRAYCKYFLILYTMYICLFYTMEYIPRAFDVSRDFIFKRNELLLQWQIQHLYLAFAVSTYIKLYFMSKKNYCT